MNEKPSFLTKVSIVDLHDRLHKSLNLEEVACIAAHRIRKSWKEAIHKLVKEYQAKYANADNKDTPSFDYKRWAICTAELTDLLNSLEEITQDSSVDEYRQRISKIKEWGGRSIGLLYLNCWGLK